MSAIPDFSKAELKLVDCQKMTLRLQADQGLERNNVKELNTD